MKMTLEQLAEKIDALSSRMDKVESKVDAGNSITAAD